MADDHVIPIGARLGSERLYADPPLGVPPELPPGWDNPEPLRSAPPPPQGMPAGFRIDGVGVQTAPGSEKEEKPRPRGKRRKRQKAANQPPQPLQDRPPAAYTTDAKWRDFGSTCLELAGITAITAGSWLIAAWLGLIVLGLCLILLGVATGLPRSQ
jgi:hypothetical protein